MTKILQGTYDLDIKIVDDEENIKDEFSEKAKSSVGGSMVFLEKRKMIWKGEKTQESDKEG